MMAEREILIVDDDVDVRVTVAEALEEEGYRVIAAADGRDALTLLRSRPPRRPALVLLDLMMPGMDGWGLMKELQRSPELATIPVVIFSAHGRPREWRSETGKVAAFLRKPVTRDELYDVVHRWAGEPEHPA